MRFAIDIAPFGELADPRAIVALATAAERGGWDGISIWDDLGVSLGTAACDPFVALAAVAAATSRLRLIASVIALPRRRPQLVAQSAATLDLASNGRLVFGVGAGGNPADFEAFGEGWESARRVALMDEDLTIIDGLLRGEAVHREGPLRVIKAPATGPRTAQLPRPPIWIGGMRPGALRRAAHWDGWIGIGTSDDGSAMNLTPDAFGVLVRSVLAERERQSEAVASAATGKPQSHAPFDIAIFGLSEGSGARVPASYADAGATWWLESLSPMRGSVDQLRRLVEAGPPAAKLID